MRCYNGNFIDCYKSGNVMMSHRAVSLKRHKINPVRQDKSGLELHLNINPDHTVI